MGFIKRIFGWIFGSSKKKEAVEKAPAQTKPQAAQPAARRHQAGVAAQRKPGVVPKEKKAVHPPKAVSPKSDPKTSGTVTERPPIPKKAPTTPPPQPAPSAVKRKRTPLPQPGVKAPPPEYENDPDHKRARRIARGMLSDIKEYHSEELKMAVKNNTFEQVFAEQLDDLRKSYKKRVPQHVQEVFDYFEFALESLKAEVRSQLS